jgi:hypothetical protein
MGYVGSQKAVAIILDGLKRLEYRGYDSAGLAVYHRQHMGLPEKCRAGGPAGPRRRVNLRYACFLAVTGKPMVTWVG